MSVDKLVDSTLLDASCTYEAGKIRAKLGSAAQIVYDLANGKGFGDAIEAIPTGGGGISADDIATNNAPSGAITLGNSVTSIGNDAFRSKPLTSIEGQNVTSIGGEAFYGCINLVSAIFPAVTKFNGGNTFRGCANLETIHFPELTNVGSTYTFNNCPKLLVGVFPKLTSFSQGLRAGPFETLDFGSKISVGNYWLTDNNKLTILILRSIEMCALNNIGGLSGTPFASTGAGGTLYVPSALVSQYTQASNWSTILGYANNQIKSIESTHTDPNAPIDLTLYYADGTLIPT